MLTVSLFTIAQFWKEPKHPTLDEWSRKLWSVYIMAHYSTMRKDEILPSASTQRVSH